MCTTALQAAQPGQAQSRDGVSMGLEFRVTSGQFYSVCRAALLSEEQRRRLHRSYLSFVSLPVNSIPCAGLHYGLKSTAESASPGFSVQVSGYTEKLPILLEAVLSHLARFTVREERFAVVKEKFGQFFKNWAQQPPYSWCHRLADDALQHGAHHCCVAARCAPFCPLSCGICAASHLYAT